MIKSSLIIFLAALFSLPMFGQGGGDDVFSPEKARSKAKALMKEDFFWSPIDESGPFGSDDGSDAAHGFYQWRGPHSATSPIEYLTELVKRWDYPMVAWDELDTARLKAYMQLSYTPKSEQEIQQSIQLLKKQQGEFAASAPNKKTLTDVQLRQIVLDAGKGMGLTYLIGLDQSIIGTAFAQIVLEDRLDPKLKYYVTKALERERLPIVNRNFGNASQQKAHNDKMRKMLFVVNQFK